MSTFAIPDHAGRLDDLADAVPLVAHQPTTAQHPSATYRLACLTESAMHAYRHATARLLEAQRAGEQLQAQLAAIRHQLTHTARRHYDAGFRDGLLAGLAVGLALGIALATLLRWLVGGPS